jgi:hypothetical protein
MICTNLKMTDLYIITKHLYGHQLAPQPRLNLKLSWDWFDHLSLSRRAHISLKTPKEVEVDAILLNCIEVGLLKFRGELALKSGLEMQPQC